MDNLPQPLKTLANNWENSRKTAQRMYLENKEARRLLFEWVDGKAPDTETKEFLYGYAKIKDTEYVEFPRVTQDKYI